MYTTQTDLSSRSSPEEVVNISLTKSQWGRLTSNVNATGMERERVMPIVDKIRIDYFQQTSKLGSKHFIFVK